MTPSCQAFISQGNDSTSLQVQIIQKGYSPSFVDKNKSYPLPTEIMPSTSLSTIFYLHKGVHSLLYNHFIAQSIVWENPKPIHGCVTQLGTTIIVTLIDVPLILVKHKSNTREASR